MKAMIRAKFEVQKVAELGYNGKRQEIYETRPSFDGPREVWISTGIPVREITLSAVCGGSPENESFATATPSGTITFQLNNPNLADAFKPGQTYYVDFTPVEG